MRVRESEREIERERARERDRERARTRERERDRMEMELELPSFHVAYLQSLCRTQQMSKIRLVSASYTVPLIRGLPSRLAYQRNSVLMANCSTALG